ncbi:hypothetical protein SPRG_18748, partial [Saprolegnia parasitica CBS 223.65]
VVSNARIHTRAAKMKSGATRYARRQLGLASALARRQRPRHPSQLRRVPVRTLRRRQNQQGRRHEARPERRARKNDEQQARLLRHATV